MWWLVLFSEASIEHIVAVNLMHDSVDEYCQYDILISILLNS